MPSGREPRHQTANTKSKVHGRSTDEAFERSFAGEGNIEPSNERRRSPLSRIVVHEGWELEIAIHEDGEGKWLLEVINELEVSTVWTDAFDTEQAALEEGLRAIAAGDVDYSNESFPYLKLH